MNSTECDARCKVERKSYPVRLFLDILNGLYHYAIPFSISSFPRPLPSFLPSLPPSSPSPLLSCLLPCSSSRSVLTVNWFLSGFVNGADEPGQVDPGEQRLRQAIEDEKNRFVTSSHVHIHSHYCIKSVAISELCLPQVQGKLHSTSFSEDRN